MTVASISYINPDDIADELRGSYEERVAEAQRVADERRRLCLVARRSFSFETVMSHPSKVEILGRANASGLFVRLFFVGIDDPRTTVERVALRVAQGGHDVPEDRIVARWHRTMGLLARAVVAAHESYIFDNSDSGILQHPRLVLKVATPPAGAMSFKHYAPAPGWVRHFVLDSLRSQ